LPMTHANEHYVAVSMIDTWLKSGVTVAQAVLRWNHPAGLHYGCSKGVNAHGVEWNSCNYQRQVLALIEL